MFITFKWFGENIYRNVKQIGTRFCGFLGLKNLKKHFFQFFFIVGHGKKCSIDTYNRRSAGGTVYRSYFKLKGCPDLFAKIIIRDTAKRKAIQI